MSTRGPGAELANAVELAMALTVAAGAASLVRELGAVGDALLAPRADPSVDPHDSAQSETDSAQALTGRPVS